MQDFVTILAQIESGICGVENEIFGGEGSVFNASRIKEQLHLIKSQGFWNSQGADSQGMSLSEKKQYYSDTFDIMSKNITFAKKALITVNEKMPGNEHVQQLLERCEKCDKEIINLYSIVRDFN